MPGPPPAESRPEPDSRVGVRPPSRFALSWRLAAVRASRRPTSLGRRLIRSLGLTLAAAALVAPFAAAWGVGHAQVEDYLGPHRVSFASDYSGKVQLDLGPLGNAYLPSPAAPIGLRMQVGGVVRAATGAPLLSPTTLAAYTTLYADPEDAVDGVLDRLAADALAEGAKAELVLLTGFALWVLRRRLLHPTVLRHVSMPRVAGAYLIGLALVGGSILGPPPPARDARIPVSIANGTRFAGLTVDNPLLADLLDRGVRGVTLLAGRQQRAVQTYVAKAGDSLAAQLGQLPRPAEGESLLLGLSDLHCSQAMTQLITRVARATKPVVILSSGDDTVNGTAAERGCVRREARIAGGAPFLVAGGNHDTDTTEAQQKSTGFTVLDGSPVQAGSTWVLGDDDPEQNLPFSVDRVSTRPETEQQLGERLVKTARDKPTDVILVHQPAAAQRIVQTVDPPARLVLWGHYHTQSGPLVIPHADGTWTVAMQEGTAGGVREPTFSSFSTPFSPPLISADVYCYFRNEATGLITGVQPLHFTPDGRLVIDPRTDTGDPKKLSPQTRERLSGAAGTPDAQPR